MTYLDIHEIEILPVQCYYYNSYLKKESFSRTREVFSYEVDVITKGTAKLTIDQTPTILTAGSVSFRKPGQWNKQDLSSPYECYAFYFHLKKKDSREIISNQTKYGHILQNVPDFLPAENCAEINKTIASLYNHYFFNSEYDRLLLQAYSLLLVAQIYRASINEQKQSASQHHPAVRKAIAYIQTHLESPLTIEEISLASGISTKYFQQIFKSSTGKTPSHFIMEQKLNRAKDRLLFTDLSIGDIAYQCGFSSHAYFTSVFKQFFQQTPQEFRNKNI